MKLGRIKLQRMKWTDGWSTGGNEQVRTRFDGQKRVEKFFLCMEGNPALENLRGRDEDENEHN
jgi:hypothetical protein